MSRKSLIVVQLEVLCVSLYSDFVFPSLVSPLIIIITLFYHSLYSCLVCICKAIFRETKSHCLPLKTLYWS